MYMTPDFELVLFAVEDVMTDSAAETTEDKTGAFDGPWVTIS